MRLTLNVRVESQREASTRRLLLQFFSDASSLSLNATNIEVKMLIKTDKKKKQRKKDYH